jgi:hypothetical protein
VNAQVQKMDRTGDARVVVADQPFGKELQFLIAVPEAKGRQAVVQIGFNARLILAGRRDNVWYLRL